MKVDHVLRIFPILLLVFIFFLLFISMKNIASANLPSLFFDSAEEDQKNNSSLLAHIANLPGFDASTARFATQYSTRSSPEKSVMEIVPTAAELMLPWRRDLTYQNREGGTFPNKHKHSLFLFLSEKTLVLIADIFLFNLILLEFSSFFVTNFSFQLNCFKFLWIAHFK